MFSFSCFQLFQEIGNANRQFPGALRRLDFPPNWRFPYFCEVKRKKIKNKKKKKKKKHTIKHKYPSYNYIRSCQSLLNKQYMVSMRQRQFTISGRFKTDKLLLDTDIWTALYVIDKSWQCWGSYLSKSNEK